MEMNRTPNKYLPAKESTSEDNTYLSEIGAALPLADEEPGGQGDRRGRTAAVDPEFGDQGPDGIEGAGGRSATDSVEGDQVATGESRTESWPPVRSRLP